MIFEIKCMLIILYLRTKCNSPHDVMTSKEMNLGGGVQICIVFSIRSLLQNLTRCNSVVTMFHYFVTYLCGQGFNHNKQQTATSNKLYEHFIYGLLQTNHSFYCELYRSHAVKFKVYTHRSSVSGFENKKRNVWGFKVLRYREDIYN